MTGCIQAVKSEGLTDTGRGIIHYIDDTPRTFDTDTPFLDI